MRRGMPTKGTMKRSKGRLVQEMTGLSLRHPRYGHRRVHALLVADGWEVNVKRVERLWRREGLRT